MPALADGVLYVGGSQNGQGLLAAIDAATLALTATVTAADGSPLPGEVKSTPLLVRDSAGVVALFTCMTENPDLCQALYGKSWESEFTRNAKKLIAERCLGEFAPDGGTEEQKYMLAFAVNGCFGTIVAWQEAGFQPPAAEIARITWQAIRAVKGRM